MNVPLDVFRLAGFGLIHGAWIATESNPICPIAIVESDSGRRVIPFEADTQAEAVARGKHTVRELSKSETSYCFLREGVIRDGDAVRDVLSVDAWIAPMDEPIVVIQVFHRGTGDRAFALVGSPRTFLGSEPMQEVEGPHFQALIEEGMSLHPQVGGLWRSWYAPQVGGI